MRKASLLMLTSLMLIAAGMLASTPVETQYTPGAAAKFKVKLPDGSTFMNVTPAEYDIGDKFNITVEIQNVANMTGYGLTIMWNATFVNTTHTTTTKRWWLSSFFMGELMAGRWGAAAVGYVGNDYRTVKPGLPPLVGAFVGLGQTALKATNNVTGTFDIVTIEFQINAYGPIWFYVWKDPAYFTPWPYTGGQPGLALEGVFPEATHATYSGWASPPLPGVKRDYDAVWATGYTGVANAILFYPPSPPEAEKTVVPDPAIANETTTVTVTETEPGFNGTASCPITNVTIDWGDMSPTNTTAGPLPIAFYHNYTDVGDYNITVYCYAEGMPPDLAWCNLTNPITVVPEFPAYLLMPLFLTATIIAVVVAKTVWSKRPRDRVDVK